MLIRGSTHTGYTDGYGHVTDVWEHLNIGRMYGYDGTFYKSTTQGWMGQKCPSYPMEDHLTEVDLAYAQYLGQGIPSCFSCERAFDGEDSKLLIRYWIDFFKRHRSLLTTDLIHLLRPNGVDLDGTVHVQPDAAQTNNSSPYRALGHIFNPRDTHLSVAQASRVLAKDPRSGNRTLLRVPLYYAGLEAGSGVDVRWMASVVADDGRTVDRACMIPDCRLSARRYCGSMRAWLTCTINIAGTKLARKGWVGEKISGLQLNEKAELMLPFPASGIPAHSFLFFFVELPV